MTTNSYIDAFADMTGGRKRRGRKPGPKKASRRSRSRSNSYDTYSSDSSSGGSVNTLLSDLLSGKRSGRLSHGTKHMADVLPKIPMGLGLNPLQNILSPGSSIANLSSGTNLANLFSSLGVAPGVPNMPTSDQLAATMNGNNVHPAHLAQQRNAELTQNPDFNAAFAPRSVNPFGTPSGAPPSMPY